MAQEKDSKTTKHAPVLWTESRRSLNDYDVFLFDCDGVLYRGQSLLPGARKVLQKLRSLGKHVFFVTNNSSLSRESYVAKFTKLHIVAHKEEVLGAAFAASAFVASLPENLFDRRKHKAFIIGGRGPAEELAELGIQSVHANDVVGSGHMTRTELAAIDVNPSVRAVIVGFDAEFTYSKASYALRCLLQNDGCIFVSTNQDVTFPGVGTILPGGGSVVSMVRAAAQREPVNTGKPSKWLGRLLTQRLGKLDCNRALFVGDRLDTDICFGNRCGFHTLLVMSGVTSPEALDACRRAADSLKKTDIETSTAASQTHLLCLSLTASQKLHREVGCAGCNGCLPPVTALDLLPNFVAPSIATLLGEVVVEEEDVKENLATE